MNTPSFIWSLYFPAPETRKWRITGFDYDGQAGLEIEVEMYCADKKRGLQFGFQICRVCKEAHQQPKYGGEKYAYNYYPTKPSLAAVIQWNRRKWERENKKIELI